MALSIDDPLPDGILDEIIKVPGFEMRDFVKK